MNLLRLILNPPLSTWLYLLALLTQLSTLNPQPAFAQSPLADDFNPAAVDGVLSLALQADGKILVGGWFTTLSGQPRNGMGRLNPDGTLDSTFNPGANDSVLSLALQADGKIVVGGYFDTLGGQMRCGLGRLNPDGTLDATFNPGTNDSVLSLALQTDGKILAGGNFTTLGGQPRDYLARLNPDGTLDTTFNPGANDSVLSLALQTDGKILVGGYFDSLGGRPRDYLGRLNPDGTLDSTFNPGADSWIYCLALQADGKILVGGDFTTLGGQPRSYLGRLNPDGTLDSTFNPGANDSVLSLALQADGKILVGGYFDTLGGQMRYGLGRLNPDGTLDSTFNPGADSWIYCLALQADGKILVGGDFTTLGGQMRYGLGRLNNIEPASQALTNDGSTIAWVRGTTSPDVWRTTFEHSSDGSNWVFLGAGTRIPSGWQLTGLSLPPDDTLRARGYAAGGVRNASGWFVERFAGRLVFVSQPASRTKLAGTTARFEVVAGGTEPLSYQWFKDGVPLADQENVAGATSATLTLSAVLKPDEGGYRVVVSNLFGSVTSLVAWLTVMDPVILVPPRGANRTVGESVTLSLTASGTPPLSYQWYHDGLAVAGADGPTLAFNGLSGADAGYYTVQVSNAYGSVNSSPVRLAVNLAATDADFNPGTDGYVYSLALQADGKIVVGGDFTTLGGQPRNHLGRLNPDGTVDSAFNPGASSSVLSLALQADGKIVVGGDFTTLGGQPRNHLGRLNPDGTVDSAFNPGASSSVLSLALQADGKIVVGGDFTTLGGQPRNGIGRLNPDGTLAATFNPEAASDVYSLALQADGKILVGGDFTSLGGQPRNGIGRLNPDGTLDSTFNPEANGAVFSLAVQADGKILVGGNFTTLGGQPRNCLGRLNVDGTLDSTFNPRPDYDVYDSVLCLAVQAEGKILVGGHFTTLGGQPRTNLGRLNADGTLDSTFNPGANNSVYSLAVQADGKIVVGGNFIILSGQPRNKLGRLNADGTLDSTFNPGANNSVESLAVQADAKVLVGGWFSTLGGQPRNYLGRLNAEPVTQSLSCDGSTITWLRGGTSPEFWRTAFEWTTDGISWFALGPATRVPGGWQCPASSLPLNAVIRARGYTVGGYRSASSWFVESTLTNALGLRLSIAREGLNVLLSWTGARGRINFNSSSSWVHPMPGRMSARCCTPIPCPYRSTPGQSSFASMVSNSGEDSCGKTRLASISHCKQNSASARADRACHRQRAKGVNP
jgi:uncharacterized delta-60 repeat protein